MNTSLHFIPFVEKFDIIIYLTMFLLWNEYCVPERGLNMVILYTLPSWKSYINIHKSFMGMATLQQKDVKSAYIYVLMELLVHYAHL
jgi:hypothetical protein